MSYTQHLAALRAHHTNVTKQKKNPVRRRTMCDSSQKSLNYKAHKDVLKIYLFCATIVHNKIDVYFKRRSRVTLECGREDAENTVGAEKRCGDIKFSCTSSTRPRKAVTDSFVEILAMVKMCMKSFKHHILRLCGTDSDCCHARMRSVAEMKQDDV